MEMIKRAFSKGKIKRAAFFTERRILAQQAMKAALEHGIDCGMIMSSIDKEMWLAGFRPKANAPLQICSWQTLEAGANFPAAEFAIFDEGHRWGSDNRQSLINTAYRDSHILYITATAGFSNGSTLYGMAQFLLQPVSVGELIDKKILVPMRCFYPDIPEIAMLDPIEDSYRIRGFLADRMKKDSLVGDPVGQWQQLGENRPTFYFGYSVDDSKETCKQFRLRDIRAVHVDAETPDTDRERWFKQLRTGEVQVICNYDVLTYGVDVTCVSCIILRRPTTSLPLYIQMIGRGMRADEAFGKTDCILLDHAGCSLYHQYVPGMREIEWTLDPNDNINYRNQKDITEGRADVMHACKKCGTSYKIAKMRQCPRCGEILSKPERESITLDPLAGNLRELIRKGRTLDTAQLQEVNKAWLAILFQCYYQNLTLGMAANRFESRFGKPPWHLPNLHPMPDFLDWKKKVKEWRPDLGKRKKKAKV